MTVIKALKGYIIEQKIRGNTVKTIRYYNVSIGEYIKYIGDSQLLENITLAELNNYYMYLYDKELASSTVQTYIRALRAFLRWCYDEEYITINLSDKMKLPKAKMKSIDVLTDNEINILLSCFNLKYIVHLRNYCICSLMLDSGLRMNEVATLTIEHLHINDGYAIVDGKGNKQRIVPLGLNTRKMLMRYLNRRPACVNTDIVFLMNDLRPITNNTVQQLFKRLKDKTGVKRIHAHLLRHTFATRYLENGGDIYSLQTILGHTTLEMVKKYVHNTKNKYVSQFSNYSPLDNILKDKKS